MNYMEQVAEVLGVELKEVFYIYRQGELIKCKLTRYGIEYQQSDENDWIYMDGLLTEILVGQCEIRELPWKPAIGQGYYVPKIEDGRGDFAGYIWSDSHICDKRYNTGMVSKTTDEAVEKAEKMLAALKKEQ